MMVARKVYNYWLVEMFITCPCIISLNAKVTI
jgi:hypothetical protein